LIDGLCLSQEAVNGTPLAARVGSIDGIVGPRLNNRDGPITRDPNIAWENIELQASEALKGFDWR
jgi:hypothetical protein